MTCVVIRAKRARVCASSRSSFSSHLPGARFALSTTIWRLHIHTHIRSERARRWVSGAEDIVASREHIVLPRPDAHPSRTKKKRHTVGFNRGTSYRISRTGCEPGGRETSLIPRANNHICFHCRINCFFSPPEAAIRAAAAIYFSERARDPICRSARLYSRF